MPLFPSCYPMSPCRASIPGMNGNAHSSAVMSGIYAFGDIRVDVDAHTVSRGPDGVRAGTESIPGTA